MSEENPQKESLQHDYLAPKPKDRDRFVGPVSWLGGREFVASLKGIIVYAIYGQTKDARSWMKSNIYPAIDDARLEDPECEPTEEVDEFWARKAKESWDWKSKNFKFWEDYVRENPMPKGAQQENEGLSEYWFDYISDTGDGQMAVYSVACLCLSDLWKTKNTDDVTFYPEDPRESELLPRGSFLFIGGDTGYYVADHSTLEERFQKPFRWAFASVRKHLLKMYGPKENVRKVVEKAVGEQDDSNLKWQHWDGMIPEKGIFWDTEPVRPLIGVPANHDYYDEIDGFNRQFRRAPFEDLEENKVDARHGTGIPLSIPTFQREQQATYIALRLPFDWWLLGIDSELEKLDFRQRVFYKELMKNFKPKKLVLATPEPTTVFGKICKDDDKTANYLRDITEPLGLQQPFLNDGKLSPILDPDKKQERAVEAGDYCRLDLSGDVHHYARYWGPKRNTENFASANYASLVSGGGGAFLHPTETVKGRKEERIEPQLTFPEHKDSRRRVAKRIFDLKNIRKGGYVQTAGAVIAVVIFWGLVYHDDTKDFFQLVKDTLKTSDTILRFFSYIIVPVLIYIPVAVSIALIFFTGKKMHDYVARLQEIGSKKAAETGKQLGARISELRGPVLLFIAGIATWFVWSAVNWFVFFGFDSTKGPLDETPAYVNSLLLIAHFVLTFLIVGISTEYAKFGTIKYKYFPDTEGNPDDWFNFIGINKKIKFMESGENRLSKWWLKYRKFSVRSIPIFVLNAVALLVLIAGMRSFGFTNFTSLVINLVFTVVVFGGLIGVISFALGAAECESGKDRGRKFGFGVIGLWHAILQLASVFILVFYAHWFLVVLLFLFTVYTNGNSIRDVTKWKRTNFGVWAMQKCGRFGFHLFATWFILGLIVIGSAIFSRFWLNAQTIPAIAKDYLGGWWGAIIILAIVAYLGHRFCRVWFSWYLAVCLAFNGHNNETGGAARIEDYKHILRMKVEKDKITVYVIGFDGAKPELDQLEPKLVDRFELNCKTFP